MKTLIALAIIVLGLLCLSLPAPAAEMAKFAPADTAVFVEVDGLAALRAEMEQDELVKYVQDQIAAAGDGGAAQIWDFIQATLGMTGEQIIDTYFGKAVALAVAEPGEGKPATVLTKVAKADANNLVKRLDMRETNQVGDYRIYLNGDGTIRAGVGGEVMALGGAQHADWMDKVLGQTDPAKSLAETPAFKAWMARLPAQRTATLYVDNQVKQETHSFAAARNGKNWTFTYAGASTPAKLGLSKIGAATADDFGPLPATVLAAISVNLWDSNPANTRAADRVLAGMGKNFRRDVLPKLSAPILLFLGETPAEQVQPKLGCAYPALGLAIKLKDVSVAADIDRVFDSLLVLANLGAANWGVDPLASEQAKHGATDYRVVQVGKLLAQRTDREDLTPIRITYGKVGDWYVLTTQDGLFKNIIDAQADPKLRLSGSAELSAVPLERKQPSMGTLVVRAPALAAHLKGLTEYWKTQRPGAADPAAIHNPEAMALKGTTVLAGVLNHFQTISLQLYKGEGEALMGKAQFIRK